MSCQSTDIPGADQIDIPALREKYRIERDKRLRVDSDKQYFRPTGKVNPIDYSVDPHSPVEPRTPLSEDLDVLIVGAGFGGIMAAYHLKQQGVDNFRNIDIAGDFGGVWYWNRYPGIQCDNDAYCYLPLLEETGYLPTKKFADGAEIYEYCKLIANKYGYADRGVFHTQVESLKWDEGLQRWRVTTNRGDDIRARFVIMACGVLNMPKLPAVPGIDSFKGKVFHTSRWDYDYTGGCYSNPVLENMGDKRVAILGTGATAIQAVPYLAKHAEQLYVIQRTPSSVDERPNPPTDPEWVKTLKPGWKQARQDNFQRAAMEFLQPGETDQICDVWTEINRHLELELAAEGRPELTLPELFERKDVVEFRVMERLRRRVGEVVKDPPTAEALKPYFHFHCKRPLSNDNYYPAFNRPNVKLVDVSDTKGLEAITETGFTAKGQHYEVDCFIFASGFEVTSDLRKRWGIATVEGRGGVSIYDYWERGPKTLHGTMARNFPNQFYIGYIQGGLNATVTEQFGQQGRHSAYIIAEAIKRGHAAVEPSQEAQDAYLERFKELLYDSSDFDARCTPSYYNNDGKISTDWGLFRGWGLGWHHFQDMLHTWREAGELEGLLTD